MEVSDTSPSSTKRKSSKLPIISIIFLLVLMAGLVAFAIWYSQQNRNTQSETADQLSPTQAPTTASVPTASPTQNLVTSPTLFPTVPVTPTVKQSPTPNQVPTINPTFPLQGNPTNPPSPTSLPLSL